MHGRMARGGHELPKVLPGFTLLCPTGWPHHETAGSLRLSYTPLDTPRRTPVTLRRHDEMCFEATITVSWPKFVGFRLDGIILIQFVVIL
jgi:hypothetical protein